MRVSQTMDPTRKWSIEIEEFNQRDRRRGAKIAMWEFFDESHVAANQGFEWHLHPSIADLRAFFSRVEWDMVEFGPKHLFVKPRQFEFAQASGSKITVTRVVHYIVASTVALAIQ